MSGFGCLRIETKSAGPVTSVTCTAGATLPHNCNLNMPPFPLKPPSSVIPRNDQQWRRYRCPSPPGPGMLPDPTNGKAPQEPVTKKVAGVTQSAYTARRPTISSTGASPSGVDTRRTDEIR